MRYIRFLKTPRIITEKGTNKSHVSCLITITSDLGDSFLPCHVELAAELISQEREFQADEIWVWRTVQWTAGMRSLVVTLPLKKSYAAGPLRVRVGVEPQAQYDTFEELCQVESPGIVSAWSAEFNSGGSQEAVKLVQRRFKFAHKTIRIWEETGESIARHLWDAGITFSHHLSSLLTKSPTDALRTALALPSTSPSSTLNVLELGTGCGILGITLASLLPRCNVTLTDLPEAQEIVSTNLRQTAGNLADGSTLSFAELDWDADVPDYSRLDLVLAADCTYNPDSSPSLVHTLHRLSKQSPSPTVAIAMKMRHSSEHIFFSLMADAGFVSTETLEFPLPGDEGLGLGGEKVDVHVYQYRPRSG